jgi:hypothetical protein
MEAVGEDRKADEEPEQVREGHPLVPHVSHEVEPSKDQGVGQDHGETGKGHLESAVMQKRHTQEGQPEEDEGDRNAEEL